MAKTLDEAMNNLENKVAYLERDARWACNEVIRLQAENARLLALNTELSLKNENLLYWIRTKIQAVN